MAKTYFYYSAMNAGKSTTLLQSNYNYKERGMDTILFSPFFDDRFGKPGIHSRIGLKEDAILFDKTFNLYGYVAKVRKSFENLRCILIDESHFLTKAQVAQIIAITKDFGVATLNYGLRSDFLGEPFEGSKYLLIWADEIVEIKTICHCGSKATMNMRIDSTGKPVKSGSQIQIGGNESYISVCMKHFMKDVEAISQYALDKEGANA